MSVLPRMPRATDSRRATGDVTAFLIPAEPYLDPDAMHFRRVRTAELAEVHALLSANGWTARIGSLQQFAELIEASQVAEVAVVDSRIVGFARGISDGRSNGYLSMIVVAAAHRRIGIGRRLVEHAMGTNPEVTWVLRAGREGAEEFFAKLGFEHSSRAMERRRS